MTRERGGQKIRNCLGRHIWKFPKGPSIYDVRKILGFLTPSPPCHVQKSADFVPFVCFLGTPSPLECGRHIWKPPTLFRSSSSFQRSLPAFLLSPLAIGASLNSPLDGFENPRSHTSSIIDLPCSVTALHWMEHSRAFLSLDESEMFFYLLHCHLVVVH